MHSRCTDVDQTNADFTVPDRATFRPQALTGERRDVTPNASGFARSTPDAVDMR